MDSTTQLATLYKLSTAGSYVQACRGITPTTFWKLENSEANHGL